MEIRYRLDAADFVAMRQHVQDVLKSQPQKPYFRFVLWVVIGVALGTLLPNMTDVYDAPYTGAALLFVALVFIGSAIWMSKWMKSERYPQWLEQFAGEYVLVLTPAGFSSSGLKDRLGFYAWSEIVGFEVLEDYVFLYLRREVALMIPCASLGSAEAVQTFADEVRRLWCAYPGNAGETLPANPPQVRLFPAENIWSNIRAAARVVFFLRFDLYAFRITRSQLFWLVMLTLLWTGATEYVAAWPAPTFNAYGLGMYGMALLLALAAASVISSALASRASLLRLLVMIAASFLVICLVYLPFSIAVEHLFSEHYSLLTWMYVPAALWLFATVFRIVQQLYLQPAPSAMYLSGVFAAFVYVLGGALPSDRLFYSEEPNGENSFYSRAGKLDVEDAYYRQSALVENALAGMRPQQTGKTDLYFVGFAGHAEEEVFGNEVGYAQDLLGRRFGAAGHSVSLVNRIESIGEIPLANVHNLDSVLQGLAQRMNKREDVLFLYLSSHGAKDRNLSVSFWPFKFGNLRAETLKEMLDKSGILNRVIVVSACYSGGFLDVLKDDNTLVLTASSRDRVSYGCGDATQYTYFGEAYLVESLAHSDSFISAFDEARHLIEAREKSEGRESSGPQIFVGNNIRKKLERIEINPDAFPVQGTP